jgi:putative transposase
MPRPLLIKSDSHPYHITSRCNNKEFFPLPLDLVWPIMLKHLKRCQVEKSLAIHAFVLMGNHFHLLCHTPLSNIDECMHSFLRSVSIEINRLAQKQNHLWSGRYRWSLINSQRHYYQVYRYIYQNPIRAKIVSNVQDYPWTTLGKQLSFPIHSTVPMTFCGEEGELIWLNEKYEEEDLNLIKLGLRKHQFDLGQRKFKAFNKLSVPSDD